MKKRALIINNGVVENAVMIDDQESSWGPPGDRVLVESDAGGPGDLFDGNKVIRNEKPPEKTKEEESKHKFKDAKTDSERISVLAKHLGLE